MISRLDHYHTLDKYVQATEQKHAHHLQPALYGDFQTPEKRHWETPRSHVSHYVQRTHDHELQIQFDTFGFDERIPCSSNGLTLEESDQKLNRAVGEYEGTETPKDDTESSIRKETTIQKQYGDFDRSNGRGIEVFSGKNGLVPSRPDQNSGSDSKTLAFTYLGKSLRVRQKDRMLPSVEADTYREYHQHMWSTSTSLYIRGDCAYRRAPRRLLQQPTTTITPSALAAWPRNKPTSAHWPREDLTSATIIIQSSAWIEALHIRREINLNRTAMTAMVMQIAWDVTMSPDLSS